MRFVPFGQVPDLSAVEAIYTEAFPEEIRSPFASLLEDDALVLLEDEKPAGLAVLRTLGDTGWSFLRYYVIGSRGRGTGSRAWPLLLGRSGARLLLDVESPEEPGIDAAEKSVRLRRIEFYRRLGMVLLPVRSYRPPHDGEPVPMNLLATAGDSVREMVLVVYEHRYGLPATDPLVVETLEASNL